MRANLLLYHNDMSINDVVLLKRVTASGAINPLPVASGCFSFRCLFGEVNLLSGQAVDLVRQGGQIACEQAGKEATTARALRACCTRRVSIPALAHWVYSNSPSQMHSMMACTSVESVPGTPSRMVSMAAWEQ
jgi:hypothetical protein